MERAGRAEARKVRQTAIDIVLASLGLMLPWSTAVSSGLVIAAILLIPPTLRLQAVLDGIKQPAFFLPVLFFLLAMLGMSWAFGVPWLERLHALDKTTKLLLLPLLLLHFQESTRARWIFAAFALSNLVLVALSFWLFVSPELFHFSKPRDPGISVRNYIDQSQAFAFLAVALSGLAIESLRRAQSGKFLLFAFVASAFFANLIFVSIALTAFAYLPLMILLFRFRYARGWLFVTIAVAAVVISLTLWAISPNLQEKISRITGDMTAYETNSRVVGGYPASGAERLEFWRKSIHFIGSAPLFGHGTGSTRQLFEAEAAGKRALVQLSSPTRTIKLWRLRFNGASPAA